MPAYSKLDPSFPIPGITLSNGNKTASADGTQSSYYNFAAIDGSVFADGVNTGVAEPGYCVEWTVNNVGTGGATLAFGLGAVVSLSGTQYLFVDASYQNNGQLISINGYTTGDTFTTGDKIGIVAYTQLGNHGDFSGAIRFAVFKNGVLIVDAGTYNSTDYTLYGYPEVVWRTFAQFASGAVQQVSVETNPTLMTYGTALTSFLNAQNYNATPNVGWVGGPVILNNAAVQSFSATTGNQLQLQITVPSGQNSLKFEFIGSAGAKYDYYLRFGATPDTSNYDKTGHVVGAVTIDVPEAPTAGVWKIMINPINDSNGSVQATYGPPPKIITGTLTTAGVPVPNKTVSIYLWETLTSYGGPIISDSVTTDVNGVYKYNIDPITRTQQPVGGDLIVLLSDFSGADNDTAQRTHFSVKQITTTPPTTA